MKRMTTLMLITFTISSCMEKGTGKLPVLHFNIKPKKTAEKLKINFIEEIECTNCWYTEEQETPCLLNLNYDPQPIPAYNIQETLREIGKNHIIMLQNGILYSINFQGIEPALTLPLIGAVRKIGLNLSRNFLILELINQPFNLLELSLLKLKRGEHLAAQPKYPILRLINPFENTHLFFDETLSLLSSQKDGVTQKWNLPQEWVEDNISKNTLKLLIELRRTEHTHKGTANAVELLKNDYLDILRKCEETEHLSIQNLIKKHILCEMKKIGYKK